MLATFWDALADTARLLPFLYLTYLAMEYLEHRLEGRAGAFLKKTGRFGPLWGGLLGLAPQCGFSAAAAGLYAGGVVSRGTLLAVFLSTSDELLPLLLSNRAPVAEIVRILALKAALGTLAGFLVDALRRPAGTHEISGLCGEGRCGCDNRSIFGAALHHTAQIALFLLLLNFLIGLAVSLAGEDALRRALTGHPALSLFLSALVGLIPNCAASVALTTLYLEDILSFGAAMAGLLTCAGAGLLVLFRVNRRPKENLRIVLLLYAFGVIFGGILELLT